MKIYKFVATVLKKQEKNASRASRITNKYYSMSHVKKKKEKGEGEKLTGVR